MQAVTNCTIEKVALTVETIGSGKFSPNTGRSANQTVAHKKSAFVMHPMSIPISRCFLCNKNMLNTIHAFPSIITGIIRGIAFIIGVAPMKNAMIGARMAMSVPENNPQYKVAIANMQFTAEPVRYTETPFID